MSAGTLALTNGSTTVTGSSTLFQTDLAVNDFIVCKIGGTTYTLGVSTIGSNTALTLTQPFSGPTTTGVAWYAVPNQTLVGITTELAANLTTVYRSVLVNDANWTKVFSQSGNITVTLKDGSTFTGPSWNSIATSLAGKAGNGANSDITSLTGLTTALSIAQGGTGQKTPAAAWAALAQYGTTSTTATVGNDARLSTINAKSGGNVTSGIIVDGGVNLRKTVSSEISQSSEMVYSTIVTGTTERARIGLDIGTSSAGDRVGRLYVGQDGTNKVFTFVYSSGNATAPGQWVNNSDRRLKTNVITIDDPLGKMRKFHGCTWDRLDFEAKGIGFIAQDVQEVFPDSVYTGYAPIALMDGAKVEEPLSLDTSGVAAALHHEAILALMDKVVVLEKSDSEKDAIISELQKRMKAIDGLDA